MDLALKLKRPLHEVMEWPIDEIRDWYAYFTVLDRERDRG